jgi:hypothetical protein
MTPVTARAAPAGELAPGGGAPLGVTALALPHPRANAVGPVRLRCAPDALEIELVRVGSFAQGFVLGGVAEPARVRVPYAAVRGIVRDGPVLLLGLDPAVVAPHNRFALARFGEAVDDALLRAWRARALAVWASRVSPPLVGLAVWWLAGAGAPVGRLSAAVLAALGCWWLSARALASLGSIGSRRLARAFERALVERLGLAPARFDEPPLAEPAAEAPLEPEDASLRASLARTGSPGRLAVAAALAVALGLVAVVTLGRFGVAARVEPPVPEARRGAAEGARSHAAAALAILAPRHPSCTCDRAALALWSEPPPEVAVLAAFREGAIDALWLEPGRRHAIRFTGAPTEAELRRGRRVELDLAVVNNGARERDEVELVLTFSHRRPDGRERLVYRGLHYPGRLAPGEAVKWRVRARGGEVRLETSLGERLGQGGARPAPAAAFAALAGSSLPEVRLHAAMMLAWLGDARAAGVLAEVGELDGAAARVQAELRAGMAPLRACDAEAGADAYSVCIHNGTSDLVRAVELYTLDGAARWRIDDILLSGAGVRVVLPLGGSAPPRALAVSRP